MLHFTIYYSQFTAFNPELVEGLTPFLSLGSLIREIFHPPAPSRDFHMRFQTFGSADLKSIAMPPIFTTTMWTFKKVNAFINIGLRINKMIITGLTLTAHTIRPVMTPHLHKIICNAKNEEW